MRGVYLCSRLHRLPGYDISYNDIEKKYKPDLCCSCEDINIAGYDYVIATPPCNYYSKANYRRETSIVALSTKHLLPFVLEECSHYSKPFIIENVNNIVLLPSEYDSKMIRFSFGGHTFWTNVLFSVSDLIPIKQNKANVCREKRDGNYNVDIVIKRFLESIHSSKYLILSYESSTKN